MTYLSRLPTKEHHFNHSNNHLAKMKNIIQNATPSIGGALIPGDCNILTSCKYHSPEHSPELICDLMEQVIFSVTGEVGLSYSKTDNYKLIFRAPKSKAVAAQELVNKHLPILITLLNDNSGAGWFYLLENKLYPAQS